MEEGKGPHPTISRLFLHKGRPIYLDETQHNVDRIPPALYAYNRLSDAIIMPAEKYNPAGPVNGSVNRPNLVLNGQLDLLADPSLAPNAVSLNAAYLVELPASATPRSLVICFDRSTNATAHEVGSQVEFPMRRFANVHQAYSAYITNHGNDAVGKVAPAVRQPSPIYIPSNAPTPAKVPLGKYSNPIPVDTPAAPRRTKPAVEAPAAPAPTAPAPAATPASVAAPVPVAPAAGSNAAAMVKAAAAPFLLPRPPKPVNTPPPSLSTPTPASREEAPLRPKTKPTTSRAAPIILAPDSDEDASQRPDIRVHGDSDDTDAIPGPRYPALTSAATHRAPNNMAATPATTAQWAIRPFPCLSPLSSPESPPTSSLDSSPILVSVTKGTKRLLPLFDDNDSPSTASGLGPRTPALAVPNAPKKKKDVPSATAAVPSAPAVSAVVATGSSAPKKRKMAASASTSDGPALRFNIIESYFISQETHRQISGPPPTRSIPTQATGSGSTSSSLANNSATALSSDDSAESTWSEVDAGLGRPGENA